MNKKSNQEIIDEFMDYFDFERVHEVMKALNWYWKVDSGTPLRIPEIPEIRQFLRKLLTDFLDENLKLSECGGFRIMKFCDIIDVSFIATNQQVEYDNKEDK